MQVREAVARKGGRQPPAPIVISPDRSFDLAGAPTSFARNEEVFGEGEPAKYLYKLMSGCIRAYTTLNDGHRQISAFYLPGDIFGLETRETHYVSTEAIMRSRVRVVKKAALMARAADDVAMANHLLDLTTAELHRTQSHILLLLRGAKERVVSFLIEMANRAHSECDVDLPMSRQDIADYLGLTIETVSRTLTRLETAALIAMPTTRRAILLNRSELDRVSS